MTELGIDEAGRGPVIGPMVIAGVVLDTEGVKKLRELGVKDSKELSTQKRESMLDIIKKTALQYKIIILSPKEIDEALNSQSSNLNKLELLNMAILANSLDSDKIIIDAPSTNTESFKSTFKIYLKNKDREMVVEHKADSKYIAVGAASILAKVTRDREIEKLRLKSGFDFGSGYPSDPKTQKFLREHYADFDFFRKTWSSWKKVANLKDINQSKLDSFK